MIPLNESLAPLEARGAMPFLLEISDSPGRTVRETVDAGSPGEHRRRRRLSELEAAGFLRVDGGRVHLTPGGTRVAEAVRALRRETMAVLLSRGRTGDGWEDDGGCSYE